jgi:Beta-glucan synthesis-associated protein SKN1/KRE6/Sbg1
MEGDGNGQEWLHAYSLKDDNIQQLMGTQIPIEPTYLIFNVAVSSTWGFPYDVPEWCPKCYDCDDPKCACSFYPGFCQMLRSGKTSMYIDYIRVYQSSNDTAHVGAPHTLGCDPPEYPTSEWIRGHEYRYMRNPPFSNNDKHPLRSIQNGGGSCTTDDDCGGNVNYINYTAQYEQQQQQQQQQDVVLDNGSTNDSNVANDPTISSSSLNSNGRGQCVPQKRRGLFGATSTVSVTVCECNDGYTGPYCLSLDQIDDTPKARILSHTKSPFSRIYRFQFPGFLLSTLVGVFIALLYILTDTVRQNKKLSSLAATAKLNIIRNNINNNSNTQVRHLYGAGVPYQHVDDSRTNATIANEKIALINNQVTN